MAHNRLFIGNKTTRKYKVISKAGDNWTKLTMAQLKLINDFLVNDYIYGKKTDLVLFTELDDEVYNYFHYKYNDVVYDESFMILLVQEYIQYMTDEEKNEFLTKIQE
jgi:hypothetical protein